MPSVAPPCSAVRPRRTPTPSRSTDTGTTGGWHWWARLPSAETAGPAPAEPACRASTSRGTRSSTRRSPRRGPPRTLVTVGKASGPDDHQATTHPSTDSRRPATSSGNGIRTTRCFPRVSRPKVKAAQKEAHRAGGARGEVGAHGGHGARGWRDGRPGRPGVLPDANPCYWPDGGAGGEE